MVKRQKEKQYLSASEQRAQQGLRTGSSSQTGGKTTSTTTRRLPFKCCALTLTPYADPVCTPRGIIFDSSAIVPYLMKHGVDPVTGTPMSSRDLIKLNMDKDEETGRWQCPVLCKPFGDRTRIVAIVQRPPGNVANVYSYEAVRELNFKPKNFDDLISGRKFHRTEDVITLQDPDDVEHNRLRDLDNFRHMKDRREEQQLQAAGAGGSGNVRHSVTAARVMDKIKKNREEEAERERKKAEKEERRKRKAADDSGGTSEGGGGAPSTGTAEKKRQQIYVADLLGVELTTAAAATSLTSTIAGTAGQTEMRLATEEEIRSALFAAMKKRKKKKGFVRLHTTLGVIDLEIHADIAPRTAANFLGLVERKKYDGSAFHRSITNFMLQGGKPAVKGDDDGCLWGGTFEDEFDDRLTHSGPGVLSMANAGPGTNKRQFFLTYKSANHLDRKHSVFGRVVRGLDVLREMEACPTDGRDRPRHPIIIERAEIMGTNPVTVAQEAERVRIEERAENRRKEKEERRAGALGGKKAVVAAKGRQQDEGGRALAEKEADERQVGKYLPKGSLRNIDDEATESNDVVVAAARRKKDKKKKTKKVDMDSSAAPTSRLPPPPKKTVYGNFSGW